MKKYLIGFAIFSMVMITTIIIASTYQYNVQFVLPNELIEEFKIGHNKEIIPINIENDEYEVLGWYYDEDFKQKFNPSTKAKQNTTLYAKVAFLATHNVFFDAYDGVIQNEDQIIKIKDGSLIEEFEFIPIREGHKFLGWFLDEEHTKPFNESKLVITEDTTIYAKWEVNQYEVIFRDERNNQLSRIKVKHGESISSNDIPVIDDKIGHTFSGWSNSTDNIKEDLIVNPVYNRNIYDLIIQDDSIKDETRDYDELINLNIPSKEGYEFKGWYYEDKDGVEKPIPSNMPDNSLTVYPKWEIKTYDVIFLDHNNDEIETQTVNHGDSATIPNNPTKEGYEFKGWDNDLTSIKENTIFKPIFEVNSYLLTLDGETKEVEYNTSLNLPNLSKDGSIFLGWYYLDENNIEQKAPLRMPNNDLKLFSKWEVIYYKVIFEVDGVEYESFNNIKYGEKVIVKDPTKQDYTFIGWDSEEYKNVTKDLRIKAIFEEYKYEIIFVDDDEVITELYKSGERISYPKLEKEGHTFIGWVDENDNPYDKTYMDSSNVTINATWEKNEYTVRFYDGENILKETTVKYGEDADLPSNEVMLKEGYNYSRLEGDYRNITKDTNIQIIYTEILHELTLINGNNIEAREVREYSTLTIENPKKEGHEFLGWYYKDEDDNDKERPSIMPSNDLELFAKWKINTYTITFEGTRFDTVILEDVEYGTFPKLPEWEKEGYDLGWNKTITKANEDTTYRAEFTPIQYKLTIMLENNDENIIKHLNFGDPLDLDKIEFFKEDHRFNDWYNNSDNEIWDQKTMPSDDVTIYAKWDEAYDVYLDDELITEEGIYPGDSIYDSLPDSTKEGYEFNGYFYDKEFNVEVSDIHELKMPNNRLSLYRSYSKKVYTVTFISDGTTISEQLVEHGNSAELPEINNTPPGNEFESWDKEFSTITSDLTVTAIFKELIYTLTIYIDEDVVITKEGTINTIITIDTPQNETHRFIGWYDASENGNLITSGNEITIGDRDLTIYANYIEKERHLVNFIIEGLGTTSSSVIDEGTINKPTDPERIGHNFKGWYLDEDFKNEFNFDTLITDDINIYAKMDKIKYEVKFINPLTDDVDVFSIPYEESATAPEVVVPDGYTFTGWDEEFDKITSDLTIYAQFKINSYTITYNTNGGTHNNQTHVTIKDEFELDDATKEGYSFVGWYNSLNDGDEYTIIKETNEDITLYARYEANTYNISFDSNGGNKINSIVVTFNNEVGQLNKPTKEGHKFIGWFYNETEYTSNTTYSIGTDITLKAKWEILSFNVSFDSNGGNEIETQQIKYGETATNITPIRDDYEFDGWYIEEVKFDFNTTITKETNLVAKWNQLVFNIEYNIDEDTTNPNEVTTFNNENSYTLLDPVKEGYTFIEWTNQNNEVVTVLNTQTLDQTLTPQFVKTDYKISYESNYDGYTNNNEKTTYQMGDNYQLKDATLDNYTFIGWYFNDEKITTLEGLNEDLTLIAKFEANSFEITYHLNSGDDELNHLNETTYKYNDTYEFKKPENRPGYIFKGWHLSSVEGNLIINTESKNIDLNLYAKWEVIKYTITYKLDGGNNHLDNLEVYTKENELIFNSPTKDGYKFIEFKLNHINGDVVTSTKDLTEDITLYAIYEKETYQISYNSDLEEFYHENEKETYQIGDTYELKEATKEGFNFIGWYFNDEKITNLDGLFKDLILIAKFEAKPFEITYHLDEGTNNENNPIEFTVNTDIGLEEATKLGYTFIGWYLDSEYKNLFTSFNNYKNDIDLYAKFEIIEYKITYEELDDVIYDENNIKSYTILDDNIKLLDAIKKYHTFNGWQIKGSNDTITEIDTSKLKDYILIPSFTINDGVKSITYNLLNKEITSNPSPTSFILSENLELLDPIGAGYEFLGWYLDSSFSGDAIISTIDFEESVTLYARWNNTPLEFSLSFITNSEVEKEAETLKYGDTISVSGLTQSDDDLENSGRVKIFAGWYLDENFEVAFDLVKMPARNITLYAKWNSVYELSFDTGIEGYKLDTISATNGTEITLPEPDRDGYTFKGFFLDNIFETPFELNVMPASDTLLYIKWEGIALSITYDFNISGTANSTDKNGVYGSLIPSYEPINDITNSPYILNGWYLDEDFKNQVNFNEYTLEDDITLYAQWKEPEAKPDITIDYNNNTQDGKPDVEWFSTLNLKGLDDPTKDGHKFIGYEVYSSEGVLIGTPESIKITDDFLIVAIYEAVTIEIEIYIDGKSEIIIQASYGDRLSDLLELETNQIVKEGYELSRFYLDDEHKESFNKYSALTEDITLHAAFDPLLYQVSFDTNGGSLVQNKFIAHNETINLQISERPVKEGYEISKFEINNQTINIDTYIVTDDVKITIVWKKVEYQFILHDSGVEEIINYSYNELIERPPVYDFVPGKGYFAGWYTDSEFTETYVFDRYMEAGTIKIYAKWVEKIDVEYYLFEDGNYLLVSTDQKGLDNKLKVPKMTRFGYEFGGWFVDQNMTEEFDFNTEIKNDEKIELYGKWNPVKYDLILNIEGEEPINLSRAYNAPLNIDTPEKEGHIFSHWIDTNGDLFTKDVMGYTDLELFAVFELNTYLLRLEANTGIFTVIEENEDGEEILVEKEVIIIPVKYNSSLEDILNTIKLSKYGYLFENWLVLGSELNISEMPAKDLTLTASYKLHFTTGLIFELGEEGGEEVYRVTGYNGKDKNILIPDYLYKDDGKEVPVISISNKAFGTSKFIETVTLGNNVHTISDNAFLGLNKLTEVTIKEDSKLKSIGNSAFKGATSLTNIVFPDSLETIGISAFENAPITNGIFGSNIKEINNRAFYNTRFTEVDLENSEQLKIIGAHAFYNNRNLSTVKLPKGLEVIDTYAFAYTYRMTSITLPEGLTTINTYAFIYGRLEKLIIPETVTNLGANIATGNNSLSELQIPNDKTIITYFHGNRNNVPKSLSKVTVYDTGSNVLVNNFADNLQIREFVLKDSIKLINQYSFRGNIVLNEINLENITEVGMYAFYNTYRLMKADLSNVQTIRNYGFAYSGLGEGVTSTSKVEVLMQRAFFSTDIVELDLPNVVTLGHSALGNMNRLKTLHLSDKVIDFAANQNMLLGSNQLEEITVPGYLQIYKLYSAYNRIPNSLKIINVTEGTTDLLVNFARDVRGLEEFNVPESLRTIGSAALYNATSIRYIDLSHTQIKIINSNSFRATVSLEEIKLPKGITAINNYSFYNSGLREFDIPNTVEQIGYAAFGYSKIREIIVPESIKTIGSIAFTAMPNLEKVYIPGAYRLPSVPTLNLRMFYNSNNIKEASLPGSSRLLNYGIQAPYQSIEKLEVSPGSTEIATYWADNIQANELIVPSSVTSIGNYAFRNMKQLKSLDLSHLNIPTIPNYLLYYATMLEELILPSTIKTIGTYSLYNTNIKSITLHEGLTSISPHSFRFTNIDKIIVPNSVTTIGQYAFGNMPMLEEVSIPHNTNVNIHSGGTSYLLYGSNNLRKLTVSGKYALSYYNITSPNVTELNVSEGTTSLVNYFAAATGTNVHLNSIKTVNIADSVTTIGNSAFDRLINAENLTLSNKLATIGQLAFYNFGNRNVLGGVDFPNTLTRIDHQAFRSSGFSEMIIPDSVTNLGYRVFNTMNNLTKAYIPANVNITQQSSDSYGTYSHLFLNAKNLKEVSIPSKYPLTYLGINYMQNRSIEELYISEGATGVVANFMYTTNPNYNHDNIKEVHLPSTMKEIGSNAFRATSIERFYFNDELETIRTNVFYDSQLKEINSVIHNEEGMKEIIKNTLPTNIKLIQGASFNRTKLKEINMPNVSVAIAGTAFQSIATLEKFVLSSNYTYADTNKSLLNGSFNGHSNNKYLTLNGKERLSTLGVGNLSNLNIILADDSKEIVNYFADGYPSIKTVEFNEGLMKIGSFAFRNTRIKEIVIPSTVVEINGSAFTSNTEMTDFHMLNGDTTIGPTILHGNTGLERLTISGHVKLTHLYVNINTIKSLVEINIAEGSHYIEEEFAQNNTALIRVNLPESVKQVRSSAFMNTSLTTINLENVEAIHANAFQSSSLNELVLTEKTISVGNEAFRNINNLTKVDLSYYIGDGNDMFKGSNNINELTIPSRLKLETFGITKDNNSLTKVIVSENSTTITTSWLEGYSQIETIILPEGLKTISKDAFKGTNIETIVIPSTVKDIQSGAFDIDSLKKVTFKGEAPTIHSTSFKETVEEIIVEADHLKSYKDVLPNNLIEKLKVVEENED